MTPVLSPARVRALQAVQRGEVKQVADQYFWGFVGADDRDVNDLVFDGLVDVEEGKLGDPFLTPAGVAALEAATGGES